MGMKVNGTSGLTFPDTTTLASAGQASVRAWVNFNGTGTVAIRAAYNVTSITDNGTGDYTLNFTNAMVDANYAVNVSSNNEASNFSPYVGGSATSSQRVFYRSTTGGASSADPSFMYVSIFR